MRGNTLNQRATDVINADLLATVSHELRSPLAAIKGYAATLLRHEQRLPRAERLEFLSAIGEASDRLEAVIERLLEMSQLEAGTAHLERFPIDVARLVEDAVAAARQRVEEHEGPDYTFVFSQTGVVEELETAPLLVCGDARHLRHALDQVLENAVKYSPTGGTVTVTLCVRATRQPRAERGEECAGASAEHARTDAAIEMAEMVEIEVRDPGIGIPPEHLDRVFERFHRIDTRLTRESDGLGLGLAIAQRIVELHSGEITAQSVPGEGSAFHIRLPLETAPQTATGQVRMADADGRAHNREGEGQEGNLLSAGRVLRL